MMIEVDSCEIHRKNPIENDFCMDDYVLVRKYKEAIWVMITLLAKIFIKDRDHIKEQKVRTAYGILSGVVGIFLNLCLFVGKFMAGFLSGSIAITADAFNNLSDAGSSIITLLGFKLANAKPDPEHPYGHGRMEYLSGLFVSILILFMAIELIQTSVGKMIEPEKMENNITITMILVGSILVKFYMMLYNKRLGDKFSSGSMKATAKDSFGDMISTIAVLISTIVYTLVGINVDGYCGILVGIFIFYTGVNSMIETINPLLGQAPDREFVAQIEEIVKGDPTILGVHDLVVHDYGPGRIMISLHAEVPAKGNMLETHDKIDNIERLLKERLNCHATIHMDPIENDDEATRELKGQVNGILQKIDNQLSMHDFRIVPGSTHTNLIFDLEVPFQYDKSIEELIAQIQQEVKMVGEKYYTVITIDRK